MVFTVTVSIPKSQQQQSHFFSHHSFSFHDSWHMQQTSQSWQTKIVFDESQLFKFNLIIYQQNINRFFGKNTLVSIYKCTVHISGKAKRYMHSFYLIQALFLFSTLFVDVIHLRVSNSLSWQASSLIVLMWITYSTIRFTDWNHFLFWLNNSKRDRVQCSVEKNQVSIKKTTESVFWCTCSDCFAVDVESLVRFATPT